MSVGISSNGLTEPGSPRSQPLQFGLYQVYPDLEEDSNDKDVDLIAIHGLDTQSPRQWVAWEKDGDSNSGEVHWLKDAHMLPKKIPNARIFTYDWPAKIDQGAAADGLLGFADGFLNDLNIERSGDPNKRPIIFIASCFGGLLLARALHRASESESKYHHILKSTAGVIFLGTPFQGSNETFAIAAQQRAMVAAMANKLSADDLVSYLQQDHKIDELVQVFRETVKKPQFNFPITCFYETLPSDFRSLREKLPPDLASKLEKDSGILVHKHSATLPGEEALPLNVRHSMICKFATPKGQAFKNVSDSLGTMVGNAGKVLNEKQVPFGFARSVKKGRENFPFGRNKDFVGRNFIMQELLRKIPPRADCNDCQWTILEGLGGVGKTQIALEAAYRLHEQHRPCSIFWAPAVNITTFENAYRDIGRKLEVPGIENDDADVKRLVADALSQDRSGSWLLVVDNIDDVDLVSREAGKSIRDYLPYNRKGSILFTTRNHEVAAKLNIYEGNVLSVEEMSEPEAVKLLVKNLRPHQTSDTEKTNELAKFLTYLPLAIRQASVYINSTGVSTAAYLKVCLSSNESQIRLLSEDFEDRHRYPGTHSAIVTTWLISFKHITQKDPLAAHYLKFMSFLAEKDIPLSILPRGENDFAENKAVGSLVNYAFINMRQGSLVSFDIHRLVRLATRNWVKNEQHGHINEVIDHLARMYPFPEHENREIWKPYLPHAKVVLRLDQDSAMEEGYLKLLLYAAESLALMSKYDEAEQMHRQALKLQEKILGSGNCAKFTNMNDLALVLESQGQYRKAEEMHRDILQARKETLGPRHRETLTSMNNLAHVLGKLEEYDAAEQMHLETLDLQKKALGTEHPDTLISMNNLALIWEYQEKYEAAEKLQVSALETSKIVLGPEEPDTLVSMNNLAQLRASLGKYKEAEQMHRQTLNLRRKTLGPENRATLTSMNNLALVLRYQEKFEEAESIHQQELALSKKVLGLENPETLVSMGNLAEVLKEQNKYEAAEEIYLQIWDLKKGLYGSNSTKTLKSMDDLASIFAIQGKYEAAEGIYLQMWELKKGLYGSKSPETLKSMNDLASTFAIQGKYEEAEALFFE